LAVYTPEPVKEERLPVLHEAIRQIGLATLVTQGAGGPVASHVPLLLDPEGGPLGTLHGHLARANPHWQDLARGAPTLAVFLGPEGYVSPSWYPTKARTGKVVPTWNYVAVHASGPVAMVEDAARLLDLVTRLTERHEARFARPWRVADAPASFVEAMLRAIVGFEMRIERLEGKWKLSQNRPAEDRAGVVEGLARSAAPGDRALAEAVRVASRPDGDPA
jgi:transcriptional regulator